MPTGIRAKEWHPNRLALGNGTQSLEGDRFVVLVLNQPLEDKHLFCQFYDQATTIAADGGANRIYDLFEQQDNPEDPKYIPNVICGDLDSIRPEVQEYYKARGVEIIKDSNQNTTDMTKCLEYVRERSRELLGPRQPPLSEPFDAQKSRLDIVIFGGLGGRADQAFSQLHHLYTEAEKDCEASVGAMYLIIGDGMIFLLEKGLNKIYAKVAAGFFTENVGIIPIGKPSMISTRGLEWDVTDWPTEFGTQISTSNHIKADVVEIETTERVLFTLEFDKQTEL